MAAMIGTDYFGTIPVALHRAIKKYNVSPSDYDDLSQRLGRENHTEILKNIKAYSQRTGMFEVYDFWKGGNAN